MCPFDEVDIQKNIELQIDKPEPTLEVKICKCCSSIKFRISELGYLVYQYNENREPSQVLSVLKNLMVKFSLDVQKDLDYINSTLKGFYGSKKPNIKKEDKNIQMDENSWDKEGKLRRMKGPRILEQAQQKEYEDKKENTKLVGTMLQKDLNDPDYKSGVNLRVAKREEDLIKDNIRLKEEERKKLNQQQKKEIKPNINDLFSNKTQLKKENNKQTNNKFDDIFRQTNSMKKESNIKKDLPDPKSLRTDELEEAAEAYAETDPEYSQMLIDEYNERRFNKKK